MSDRVGLAWRIAAVFPGFVRDEEVSGAALVDWLNISGVRLWEIMRRFIVQAAEGHRKMAQKSGAFHKLNGDIPITGARHPPNHRVLDEGQHERYRDSEWFDIGRVGLYRSMFRHLRRVSHRDDVAGVPSQGPPV